MHKSYGKAIAHYRKSKGITQAGLGSLAGLPQNTISNMESDKVKSGIRASDMVRISQALDEPEVLVAFCKACPVRPYLFSDGVQTDPAEVLERLRSEMAAVAGLASTLSGKLSSPGFNESQEFKTGLAQVRKLSLGIAAIEAELSGCSAGCAR
jgi:transcriptional regulator with XRE-family HTH domain